MQRLLFVLWGLGITAGAVWIRFGRPQDTSPAIAALVYSEPFHVFAHLLLYGTMAWLAARKLPLAWVPPAVVALGAVQELAQVVGLRSPGAPELFDLGVDTTAALLVVAGLRRWRSGAAAHPPAAQPPAAQAS